MTHEDAAELEHLRLQVMTDDAARVLQASIDERDANQVELFLVIKDGARTLFDQIADPAPGAARLASMLSEAVASYEGVARQLTIDRAALRRWHLERGYPTEPPA